MGSQILRQPDDQYAIFSTESDTLIVWDASPEEIVDWFVEAAADRVRTNISKTLRDVADGNPEKAYYQFAMTWLEALADDREHDGRAWKQFGQHTPHFDLDPATWNVVYVGDQPGPFTAEQFDAIIEPLCPTCGAMVDVDRVEVTAIAAPVRLYVPARWSCPFECDTQPRRDATE